MTEPTAPAPKPTRTIRLLRPPVDGVAVFSISTGARVVHYAVHEIRCDIGGRGFAVHKLGLGTLYHVRIGKPQDCSCECKGFLYHGYCRHILGLLALVRQGKL